MRFHLDLRSGRVSAEATPLGLRCSLNASLRGGSLSCWPGRRASSAVALAWRVPRLHVGMTGVAAWSPQDGGSLNPRTHQLRIG